MARKPSLITALVGVSAVSVLLAGCQGVGPSGNSDANESPLSEYLQALWSNEAYDEDTYLTEEREIQDLVATCMAQDGFDYIPYVYDSGISFGPIDMDEYDGPEWGSIEFAEQYGYGIVTSPWDMFEPTMPSPNVDENPDPNWEYVETLSASEQEAYYAALYGEGPTEEEYELMASDPDYMWEPTDTGCYGEAQEQIRGDFMQNPGGSYYDDPEYEDIMVAMEQLWSDLESSSEAQQLFSSWLNCMQDSGAAETTWTNRWDAQNLMYEEWNDLHTSGSSDEWREPSEAQRQQFQEREIEVAVADATCATEVKYDETFEKLQFDAEREFINKYKDRLDAMIAQYAIKK